MTNIDDKNIAYHACVKDWHSVVIDTHSKTFYPTNGIDRYCNGIDSNSSEDNSIENTSEEYKGNEKNIKLYMYTYIYIYCLPILF